MSTCSSTQHLENGQCCDFCPEGKYVSSHCNKTSGTKCSKCPHGSFTSEKNYMRNCLPCRQCHSENQVMLVHCKENSDEQCACKRGFYCSDKSSGHCEHCSEVTVCQPGEGVVVQHTTITDTLCRTCEKGTYNGMKDYETPCVNHTNCEALGRHLLTAGTTTTDAKCGDLIQNCHWVIPAGLWAGLIMTIVVFGLVLLYQRTKRKSQQTVNISECSQSYVPPVLPPDVIKHPKSPELQTLFHKDETCSNTCDFSLECDGMTMTTMAASEKYAYSPCQGQCGEFTTSDPSILQSEPQEDEWPGA